MIQKFALAHHRFCHFHMHDAHIGKLREVLGHPLRLLQRFMLLLIATPAGGVPFAVELRFDSITHFDRDAVGTRGSAVGSNFVPGTYEIVRVNNLLH